MSNRPPNGPRRSKRLRKAVVGSSATSSESDGSSPRYRFPDSDDAIAARPQEIEAEDKCSICLQRLQGSDLGSPGVCGHVFCLDCIVKWSMNSNTCPVDRNAFYKISVRRRPGGPVVRVIPVYPPLKLDSVHGTTCEVCASVDGLATMLICDNCARGFHLQCLRPSLEELPDVQWVCPACNTRGDASLHQILLVLNNQYRNSESSEPDDASSEEEEDEEQKRFTDHMRSEPGLFYQRLRDFVDQARTWRYLLNMVNEYDPYGEPQPSTSTGRTSGEGGSRRPLAKKCKYKRRNRTVCPDSMQVHAKVTVRNKKQEVSIYGDAPSMLRAGPPSFAEELQVTSGASLVLAAGPTSHILDAHRQARIKMASVSTLSSILDAHTVVRTRSSLLSLEGFLERIPEPRSTLERETAKMNLGRAPEKTRAAGGGYRGGGGGGPPSRPAHASPRPAHAAHRHAHAAHRPTPPAPYDPTQPTRGDSSEDDGDCPNFSVYSATSVHIAGRDDDDEADERCPVTRNARTPIKIKFNTHTLIKRPVGLYDDEEDSVQDEIDENITVAQNTSETIERVLDDIDDFEVAKVTDTNEMVTSHDVPAEKNAHGLSEEGVIVNNNGHHVNNTDDTVSDDYEDISIKEDERDGANGLFDDDLNSKKGPVCKNGEKITESISETEDERSYTPCLDENKSKDNSLEIGKENIGIEGLDTEMISEDEGNELFSDGERSDKSRHIIKREKVPRDREEGEISEKRKGLADTSNRDDAKRKKKKDSKKESKDKKLKNKKSDVVFKKLSKNGKERNYRDKVDRNNRHSSSDRDKARRKEKRKDLQRYDVRTLVGRRKQKDPFGRDVSPVRRSRTPSPRPSPMSTPYRGERRRRAFSRRSDSRGRNTISRSATPNLSSTRRSLTPSRRRSASRRRRKSISPKQRRSISLGAGRTESPRLKRSTSQRPRRSASPRTRRSASPRTRRSSSPRIKRSMSSRGRRSISKSRRKRSTSAKRKSPSPSRRRATPVRGRKRPRRSSSRTPRLKLTKKKRRSRSRQPEKRSRKNKRKSRSPRRKSPKQKKKKAAKSVSPELELSPALWPDSDDPAYAWSGGSPGLTPPRRRDPPGKEVFTSGDNILVSVSFDDEGRRRRRPRRDLVAKPVAIIDLDRSPFRELTPSPENVIVLSDSSPSPPAPAPGPKTPPSPAAPEPPAPAAEPAPYDPFEPTKSPEPAPILMTLETAQQTNMSADDVVNQRPVSPLEKVLALLQSTRDLCPAPAPYERPALPPASSPPPARPDPAPEPESPYSPGSGDFGDLFSPPAQDAGGNVSAQDAFDTLFGKQSKGKDAKDRKLKKNAADESRTDEKDLEILDELPNSAVEMQVKSKFLKKLNRQERVVEEVKLVLKPHYNKKRLSKDDYKDILRRAVPKICHNKSGEINPAKIQALVEAYVRKFRKRRKLGLI